MKKRKSPTKELIPNRLFENAKPNFISYLLSEKYAAEGNHFFGTIGMLFKDFKDVSLVLNYCDHCTQ